MGALTAETAIRRARVYGSRQTGMRRSKADDQPSDIDLAIEVGSADPDEAFTIFFDAASRLSENARMHGVLLQIDDLTNAASSLYEVRQRGTLILDRTSTTDGSH